MTIARIEHVAGSRDTENIILLCTGCDETFNYSVRQYKGDFDCNITEFKSFLQWAKWEASRHECFLVDRVGYLPPDFFEGVERGVEALNEGRISDPRDATPDDPLAYHVDFPQVETREEDPWGGVGYVGEPLDEDPLFADDPMDDGDWDDELDAWMDEELDLPPLPFACGIGDQVDTEPLDPAKTLDFRRLYEMGPTDYRYGALSADEAQAILLAYVHDDDSDNYDWSENRFGFLHDRSNVAASIALGLLTGTGRKRSEPEFIFEIREMPRRFEGEMVYIEFDFAETEQRIVDQMLLDVGVYSLDDHGCLRDEKGRCLACLRPGPHFPFYYGRDKR